MLRNLALELESARGMTEKQLAAFRRKMEKQLADLAASKVAEDSATTKSLFSGRCVSTQINIGMDTHASLAQAGLRAQ